MYPIPNTAQMDIQARHLTAEDAEMAADVMAGSGRMPYGWSGTSPRTAWFSAIQQALNYSGLPLGMFVGGGGMSGVFVALPTTDPAQLVYLDCHSMFMAEETVPGMIDVALGCCVERSQALVCRVQDTNPQEYTPMLPGGSGGTSNPDGAGGPGEEDPD